MSAPNLRTWRYENGTYVSPRFPDFTAFDRCKKYFIRAKVEITFDDKLKTIKVPADERTHADNFAKLKKLGIAL